jgi:hypothetical protein
MNGPNHFGICGVIRRAKTKLYLQRMNIPGNEILKKQTTHFSGYWLVM